MSCWWCRIGLWVLIAAVIALAAPAIAGSSALASAASFLTAAGAKVSVDALAGIVIGGLSLGIGSLTDLICCKVGFKRCCG